MKLSILKTLSKTVSLLFSLVFIQILYLDNNSLVIALPKVASNNGIIILLSQPPVNTTTHSVGNDFREATQPSDLKLGYKKYNLYNTINGKTIQSQGSRHSFKNYSQVHPTRNKEVDPNGRPLQTIDPSKFMKQYDSSTQKMRSASDSTDIKDVYKTGDASVVGIILKRLKNSLRSRIKRSVKNVKSGRRNRPTTATPLVTPPVTNATSARTFTNYTVRPSLLSASSDKKTISTFHPPDPLETSTSPSDNTIISTFNPDRLETSTSPSDNTIISTFNPDRLETSTSPSDNTIISTFNTDRSETSTASFDNTTSSEAVAFSTSTVYPLDTSPSYLDRTSLTYSSSKVGPSESSTTQSSTDLTTSSSIDNTGLSDFGETSMVTISAEASTVYTDSYSTLPTFNHSSVNPSVTNTPSSIVSPCAVYSCSSECELWPWLLFVIFLCLIILFMLLFLVFYISKLLSTRNVSDIIDFNSCNSVNKQANPFGQKGYLETSLKGQTKSNVLEPQIDSSSLRFVSSGNTIKTSIESVLVNEKVQKSSDVTNVSQTNLWNIDKDLLTSSGRDQNSYMEYKEIQRSRPRSVVFNVASTTTTISSSHPNMATKSKEVADYHYQKEDLKKLEEGASVFKNTYNSSSNNALSTSFNIDSDEVISISSVSKHSKSQSNESNSLTVPPSTPTKQEPTVDKQKVSKTSAAILDQPLSSGSPLLSQSANDNEKSQTLMYSQTRRMETEKLKRNFLNVSDSGTLISPNNQQFQQQHHSFVGTYNRLQKRLEMERQRSKSGEKISNYNIVGTVFGNKSVSSSSATTTKAMISTKSANSYASTETNSGYTYSKGQGMGETVLIVNEDEGWFKLESGSVSPGNVTKVHKIIQLSSKQKQYSSSDGENDIHRLQLLSSGATIETQDTTL